jgi:HlyD family type I secretion membrane fusion protein
MPPLPSLIRPKTGGTKPGKDLLSGPISAFESETQAVLVRTTPYSEHAILHVIAGIIVLAVILMAVIKLDRVVTSAGQLVPTRGTLFVQPLDRAIVRLIKVHTGDVVKAGQVLAELDPTFAQADVTQYQLHLASATALVTRLEAELADRPYAGGTNPSEVLQMSIWRQRQSEFNQMVASDDAKIHSAESAVTKAQQDVTLYDQRLDYARKNEAMEKKLYDDGNGSMLKLLAAQDTRAETDRLLQESRNALIGGRHDLDSLKALREQDIGKWKDDTGTQLVAARDDLHQTEQFLAKANKTNDLITLQAPEDAVVLDIGPASTGSIVDANSSLVKPMFTLMPISGPLEAEVQIKGQDIGFVRVGDTVRIKMDAYPYMRHGVATGKIMSISEGSFATADAGSIQSSSGGTPTTPYFKALVSVDSSELHNVPTNFRLIPGMTLTGDVLVGKRTMLSYLIEGGLRTVDESMREP